MPFVRADGARHYYRLTGPAGAPVVIFAHALGLDHGMWDPQAAALEDRFQVLRYDLRGHGASDVVPGEYTIEGLARDALAIADAMDLDAFAFCGLSIGGMVAQWLAAHAPDRVGALVLANTTWRTADPAAMEARRRAVLEGGMASVTDAAVARFFSPAVLATRPAAADWARRTLLATDSHGYAGCCAAVRDLDHAALLSRISAPTLVIGGALDASMPWPAHGQVLAERIAGAQVVTLPAAHISNLEQPEAFTTGIRAFLDRRHPSFRIAPPSA